MVFLDLDAVSLCFYLDVSSSLAMNRLVEYYRLLGSSHLLNSI